MVDCIQTRLLSGPSWTTCARVTRAHKLIPKAFNGQPLTVSVRSSSISSSLSQKRRTTTSPKSSLAEVDTYMTTLDDNDEFYEVEVHTVRVHDRRTNSWLEFQVPEDRYILQTGEEHGINLPFACRHGCCTACAVRVVEGQLSQPHALGISSELKQQGYALLCVGSPRSDLEVETQDEDEVYWLQFGRYFAKGPVERDDYALELAVADE